MRADALHICRREARDGASYILDARFRNAQRDRARE
jgi:hypothetical protein